MLREGLSWQACAMRGPFKPILCYERAKEGFLVPRRLSNWSFPVSLVPFLPLWCLPGVSQTVQMVLSCLPGASLVPCKLSNGSVPASLVPRKLSNESFPASLVPFRLSKLSFPASLVPLRLSKWSFPLSPWCLPVTGNPVLQAALSRPVCAAPTPGFASIWAVPH